MPSLKATFLVLISAAFSLPSLAQAPGANNVPAPAAPNKAPVVAAKTTTVTTSKAPTKVAPIAKVTQSSPAKTKKTAGKRAAEPQPQVQLPPPPPPTPAQLPPNPARVTMRNGLLTIDANNSTLADVLTGVRRETKAAIDLPAGASGERVVASIGPGTPQNVLTALLNGSRFDYIILGSQDQPDTVQRVILRAKSGPEPATSGGGPLIAQRGPNPGGVKVQPVQPEESDEGTPAEEIPDENNPQPQQQEIDGEQQQGQQQQQEQQQQQQQQQPQQGVKTPEQLLEELRQMQQQQQQQQQQNQPQQGQPQPYQQQPQQPSPDEQ